MSGHRMCTAGVVLLAGVLAVGGASAQVTYSLGADVPLLDAAFYAGEAGLHGAESADFGLRWAYLGAISNGGSRVAFLGLRFDSGGFTQRLHVVDIGDPSNWREVVTNEMPLYTPVWSPDDQYVAVGRFRINVDTGAGANDGPAFPVTTATEPNLADACLSSALSFGFNTDGDAEGWENGLMNDVSGLTVSNGTLKTTFTGTDPHISSDLSGFAPVDAASTPYVVLRMKVDNNTGDGKLYWATVAEPFTDEPKSVEFELGPEGTWNTYVLDMSGVATWTDDIVFLRLDPASPIVPIGGVELDFIGLCTSTGVTQLNVPIQDDGSIKRNMGSIVGVATQANPLFAVGILDGNILSFPVGNDFSVAGPATTLVDFPSLDFRDARVSLDGTLLTTQDLIPSAQPDFSLGGYESAQSDLYILGGIQDIINGAKTPAATSYADARFSAIRTQTEGGSRYKALPVISPDNELVFFAEDFNDQWQFQDTSEEAFTRGAWDILMTTSLGDDGPPIDGANNSDDLQFIRAGNELLTDISRGGLRLIYQSQSTLADPLRLFVTTLISATSVANEVIAVPMEEIVQIDDGMGGTTDGAEVTDPVTMEVIQIAVDSNTVKPDPVEVVTVSAGSLGMISAVPVDLNDGSGTELILPEDTIINFPDGFDENDGFSVETPADVLDVTDVQASLQQEAQEIDVLPVLRNFGPDGTMFAPPIVVTIKYTDAEVTGLNEANLAVFTTDDGINFDRVDDVDIVERDLDNNIIRFRVSHFSLAAVGGSMSGLPAQSPTTQLALALVLLIAGVAFAVRSLPRKS